MITVSRRGPDRVLVASDWPMRDKELMKSLPGAKYDLREHVWTAPLTWAAFQAMRGMFGEQMQFGEDVQAWAWAEWRDRVEPALKLRGEVNLDGVDDEWAEVVRGWRGYDYPEDPT